MLVGRTRKWSGERGVSDATDAALVAARVSVFPETVLSRNKTALGAACRNSITDHLVSLHIITSRYAGQHGTWFRESSIPHRMKWLSPS